MLKTVQITLPEELLLKVDQTAQEQETNRSAFIRKALEEALFKLWVERMEREDAEEYARLPQDAEETTLWESIQEWGDPYEEK